MKVKFSIFLILVCSLCKLTAQEHNFNERFNQKQLEHKVLVQYYRWFQTFEIEQNDKRTSNHLNILTDDIIITVAGDTINGKDGFKGLLNYVKDWRNAHHVLNTTVTQNNDGTINLKADILYQNILPDSTKNNTKLQYNNTLKIVKNQLPIFTRFEVSPIATSTLDTTDFVDAYASNRAKSFVYYWLYLLDNINGNIENFKSLLGEDITLNFPDRTIKNYDQFNNWAKKFKSDIHKSLHVPKNITGQLNEDGTIQVSFDVEWIGIDFDGKKINAQLHHDWVLENNLDEPFARIKSLKFESR